MTVILIMKKNHPNFIYTGMESYIVKGKKSCGPTYMVCPILSIKVKDTYISVDTCKYLLSVDRKCQEGWTMVIMQRDVAVKTEERSFISYFNNFKRCGAFIHDFILFFKCIFQI